MRGVVSGLALMVGLGVFMVAGAPGDADASASWADEQGVREAVLDYVEGIYDVEPDRIERSVHRSLRKVGYMRRPNGEWGSAPMNYDQLYELAANWNADGHLGADAPKEIEVLDVLDQTASAKLVADWGVDYFHLARIDGRWQIMNVIWQTPPTGD